MRSRTAENGAQTSGEKKNRVTGIKSRRRISPPAFAMQKHSKIRNVPFPRPCGATGNDAQKLHAPAFAHFRGVVLMHEVLYLVFEETEASLWKYSVSKYIHS